MVVSMRTSLPNFSLVINKVIYLKQLEWYVTLLLHKYNLEMTHMKLMALKDLKVHIFAPFCSPQTAVKQ